MKTEPSRLILRKLSANLELLMLIWHLMVLELSSKISCWLQTGT